MLHPQFEENFDYVHYSVFNGSFYSLEIVINKILKCQFDFL